MLRVGERSVRVLSGEGHPTEGGTLRRLLLLAALCMATTLMFAPAAMAQDEFDCGDFDFQEDAQAVYDEDTSDPSGLDGPIGTAFDGEEGVACEDLPSRGSGGDVPVEDEATTSAEPSADQYNTEDQYDAATGFPVTVQYDDESATATATASPLPDTGGVASPAALSLFAALLLVGGGIVSASIVRHR